MTREERDAILARLAVITREEFQNGAERFIEYIELSTLSGKATGELRHANGGHKPFVIRICPNASVDEQPAIFVHEVLHIPLILAGHDMYDEDEEQYRYVENKIDEAACAFYAREPNLVQDLYHRLQRP